MSEVPMYAGSLLTGLSMARCGGTAVCCPVSMAPTRKVDIRLHGKGNSKLPWRKAGQPSHLVDVVDSDQ